MVIIGWRLTRLMSGLRSMFRGDGHPFIVVVAIIEDMAKAYNFEGLNVESDK